MTEKQLHSLNHYLQDLELPFHYPVVTALIREALGGDGDPADIISRRIYQIAGAVLPGEDDPLLFEQLIFDLYKEVKADYNKEEDETFSPMRGRILDLIDKWMQLSDFLNEKEQLELSGNEEIQTEMDELMKFVQSLLERLNHPEKETPESARELSFLLDQSEEVFGRFMGQVEEMLNPQIHECSGDSEGQTLVVRVEIKDAGHPVWREVRVPGNITLDRFHLILQKCNGLVGSV